MSRNDDEIADELGEQVVAAVRAAAAAGSGAPVEQVTVSGVRRLSGGASRHTWRVETSSGRPMIVQRERPGSVGSNLPMEAQTELLRAAHGLGVPVPRVLGEGDDGGLGYVVLEYLAGESVPRRVLRDPSVIGSHGRVAHQAGVILATIHSMDTGGHPALQDGDPLLQMRSLLDMLGEPHPAFEVGLGWLARNRPVPRGPVVVHGDFRLGNLLIEDGTVTAVLDWELAHLGSPAEDLGWFCGRAWRFGSSLRAGGLGSVEQLLDGYAAGGGIPPDESELDWWEAYGTLRWGLICVLQASVHLGGHHRSIELAAIGRRAAECEEDLLELVTGHSGYEPPDATDGTGLTGPNDRPTAVELLDAIGEHLEGVRESSDGSTAFHLRVAGNVVSMVGREVALASELEDLRSRHLDRAGAADEVELANLIRDTAGPPGEPTVAAARALVRDKLAVSNPGYWRGDT